MCSLDTATDAGAEVATELRTVKGRYLSEKRGGVGDGNDWGLEEMKGFESDAGAMAIFSVSLVGLRERERERRGF